MLWALAIQSKSAAEVENQIIGFYMPYLVGEKARQSGNSLMSHMPFYGTPTPCKENMVSLFLRKASLHTTHYCSMELCSTR